jgi:DNA-3-methyladenine glycosylase I
MKTSDNLVRCPWCEGNDLYIDYHDKQWGEPLHDDNKLFELLTLEGAQAGLSWLTVLKRRQEYVKAFEGFNPKMVAKFSEEKLQDILENSGIIKNKLKVYSVVQNGGAILKVQKEFGNLDKYLWSFVSAKPIQHHLTSLSTIPANDQVSLEMSKNLRKRGFNFVGPTICYAFMQASGMVNDHLKSCFRYKQLAD